MKNNYTHDLKIIPFYERTDSSLSVALGHVFKDYSLWTKATDGRGKYYSKYTYIGSAKFTTKLLWTLSRHP